MLVGASMRWMWGIIWFCRCSYVDESFGFAVDVCFVLPFKLYIDRCLDLDLLLGVTGCSIYWTCLIGA